MNAGLDKQLLQEFYERMSDDEIIRIVTNDVAGLTREAREVITMEVKRRRLDVDTAAIADAEPSNPVFSDAGENGLGPSELLIKYLFPLLTAMDTFFRVEIDKYRLMAIGGEPVFKFPDEDIIQTTMTYKDRGHDA
jgi:hypothetical protein